MSKSIGRTFSLVAVLAVAGSLVAADVWKDKDYKQWDEKDATKIMNDSPWAKSVVVGRYWTAGSQPGNSSGGQANAPSTDMPMVTFHVRWISSITMHRAIARDFVLARGGTQDKADEYANETPDTYDLVVLGADMYPFGTLDTGDAVQQLDQRTFLENKESKLHVAAVKAEVVRDKDNKTVTAVTFHFPKKNPDGSPLFASGMKGVDFVCTTGKAEIKAHFDFTKMTGQNGLDL
ncbi:MAG: hypothetical protein ACLP1Y_03845 [Candidatus Acidiferrales bacterium]